MVQLQTSTSCLDFSLQRVPVFLSNKEHIVRKRKIYFVTYILNLVRRKHEQKIIKLSCCSQVEFLYELGGAVVKLFSLFSYRTSPDGTFCMKYLIIYIFRAMWRIWRTSHISGLWNVHVSYHLTIGKRLYFKSQMLEFSSILPYLTIHIVPVSLDSGIFTRSWKWQYYSIVNNTWAQIGSNIALRWLTFLQYLGL